MQKKLPSLISYLLKPNLNTDGYHIPDIVVQLETSTSIYSGVSVYCRFGTIFVI